MITVTIAINGNVIMARSAVNRLAEIGKYVCDDETLIEHDPADGAVMLAAKMLGTLHDDPDRVVAEVVRARRRR